MSTRAERPEWQRIAEAFEASGQTQREFAEGRGLRLSTLQSWVYRRRRQVKPEAEPVRLLPVQVSPSVSAKAVTVEVLTAGGTRVRFAPGTDMSDVARLVAALERGAC